MDSDIGSQCSTPLCREIDFLPIKCRCGKQFCKTHAFPDRHDCDYNLQADPNNLPAATAKRELCSVDGCKKLSLESVVAHPTETENRMPAICTGCQHSFCSSHRHASAHSCPSLDVTEKPIRNLQAHAILAKNFAQSPSSSKTIPTRAPPMSMTKNPAKLAQMKKVELMKMRHQAVSGDPKASVSIKIEDRIYIKVTKDGSSSSKVFWFPKDILIGRVFDYLSSHFSLPSVSAKKWELCNSARTDEHTPLKYDQDLQSQVENGSQLLLTLL